MQLGLDESSVSIYGRTTHAPNELMLPMLLDLVVSPRFSISCAHTGDTSNSKWKLYRGL